MLVRSHVPFCAYVYCRSMFAVALTTRLTDAVAEVDAAAAKVRGGVIVACTRFIAVFLFASQAKRADAIITALAGRLEVWITRK